MQCNKQFFLCLIPQLIYLNLTKEMQQLSWLFFFFFFTPDIIAMEIFLGGILNRVLLIKQVHYIVCKPIYFDGLVVHDGREPVGI